VKRLGVELFCLGTLLSVPVRAQPQADAALADDPKRTDSLARWRTARATEEPPLTTAEPPLTTAELRDAYPDLELSATPHRRVGLFLGAVAPFQLIALGFSADVYFLPRFRVSSFVTGGALKNSQESRISMYAELGLGLVLGRWRRTTTIALPAPSSSPSTARSYSTDTAVLHGTVPVSHSLEVELGAITGYYPLYRCVDGCITTASTRPTLERFDARQLLIPFAGLRYGYYRWARSRSVPFRSTQRFEVSADLLTRPVNNNPPPGLVDADARPIKRGTVGARVTLRLPAIQTSPTAPAIGLDVVAGYLPSPGDVILQFSFSVL
jgi:hypothetical protein